MHFKRKVIVFSSSWRFLLNLSTVLLRQQNRSGVRGIFFRGGTVTFPDFIPALKKKGFFLINISILVHPKQISVVSFYNYFSPPNSNLQFWPSLLRLFTIFPFPVGQQKFPGENLRGALCPLSPTRLLHHCKIVIHLLTLVYRSDFVGGGVVTTQSLDKASDSYDLVLVNRYGHFRTLNAFPALHILLKKKKKKT